MSETEFYKSIEGAFHPLLDIGYDVADRHYSAGSFGNGWVTYRSESLVLRVLRDRGQHFVEFSVPGSHASGLYYGTLREVLERPRIEALPDLAVKDIARHVIEDLPGIEVALSDGECEKTVSAMREWQVNWEEERFGRPGRREAEG